MRNLKETPHFKWRDNGIGNIRLYHHTCPKGRNISDPQEYITLVSSGWKHHRENIVWPEKPATAEFDIKINPFADKAKTPQTKTRTKGRKK